ncbi:unnamed protein product [Parnassius mnemosyne]|uniref:HTH psq-type domain-containing protein n=1 Tax=Parnassius mnemosyne TaxID=213953 RepID=A0AAV1KR71_9NEOP
MVRSYKKTADTRNYKKYTEEIIEEAIEKITNDELSINAASIQYKIPYGTLYNKYKGLLGKTPGGQPVSTNQEEFAILRAAATFGDWVFPLTLFDLRMFGKGHLDRQGKIIEWFSNNLPGFNGPLRPEAP